MSVGDVLLYLAAFTLFLAFATRIIAYMRVDKKLASQSGTLSLISFMIITVAFLYLLYLFLTSDVSYYYVWSYSSTDLDIVYKLSAVWAGAQGSLLLWIWFMSIVLAVETMLEGRRDYLSRKFRGIFNATLSGTLFVFMLMLIGVGLFERTGDALMNAYPNGGGLALSLQTPEMIIHPPVVFAGYAAAIATAGAALAYFVTNDKNWHTVALPWTRIGWILLSLGIGIGGLWAYYVLGWGGYWAWDPVETSSLIPWFIATALLHTLTRHSRKGEYEVMAPTLGVLTFIGMLYAGFATRAGSIWSSSVHAFAGTVMDDPVVLGLLILMIFFLVLGTYLAYARYRRFGPKEDEAEPEKLSEYVSDRNNMVFTVALLVVTAAVMIFILFKNVNVGQQANYTEFNQKMSLFFVLLMVTMTLCLTWKTVGKERALWFGIVVIGLSVALAIAAALSASIDWLVAFSVPSYVIAMGAAVLKISQSVSKGSPRRMLLQASAHLIHLGVAMLLFSYVVSSNMQTYPSDAEELSGFSGVVASVGDEVQVGEYTILLQDLEQRSTSRTSGGTTITSIQEATIDISKGGSLQDSGVLLTNLYGHNIYGVYEVLEVEVHVHKSVLEDLYINYQLIPGQNQTAFVQAKVIPMMNFLWTGFGLLVFGLALRLFFAPPMPSERGEEKKQVAPQRKEMALPSKAEKDYEALIEEEIKRLKQKRRQ